MWCMVPVLTLKWGREKLVRYGISTWISMPVIYRIFQIFTWGINTAILEKWWKINEVSTCVQKKEKSPLLVRWWYFLTWRGGLIYGQMERSDSDFGMVSIWVAPHPAWFYNLGGASRECSCDCLNEKLWQLVLRKVELLHSKMLSAFHAILLHMQTVEF